MAEETRMQEQNNVPENGGNEQANEPEAKEVTLESLSADNARLRADLAKQKLALDKALHNNGELTKQLRAKMTAQEQEDAAKKEQAEAFQARMAELETYKKKNEAKERYLTMGMSAEFAKEAAEAEVAGDMDTLTAVYKKHNEATIQASKDEWLKSRPEPNAGKEESAADKDPFLAGFMQ